MLGKSERNSSKRNECKIINKEDINNFKEESKIILDKYKSKIENISKDIARVKETLKNKYIPVPYYIMRYKKYQIQKRNNDILENINIINVRNIAYSKSNLLIPIYLSYNNNFKNKNKR